MNQVVQVDGVICRPTDAAQQSPYAPTTDLESSKSVKKWHTPWHDHVDENGILAQTGHFRVVLRDDQWMLERFNARWKPISYHRECSSLLRTLREKCLTKGNEHLVADLRRLHLELEAL